MNLQLVLIILFLLGAIACSNGTFRKPKKIYIGWCTFFILLSVSLKCSYYGLVNGGGADTLKYIHIYKETCRMSFQDIWEEFMNRYIYHTGSEADIGYTLLQWGGSRFTDKYHIFSTLADLLFYIPFAKILNKYCNSIAELFLAFMLYISLFHTFAMYGARQFFAMGFGLMFFLCYSERKYKKAFIALLLGTTLHMSLLLVLVPFVISFFSGKTIKIIHVVTLLLVPAVLLFANPIISFMGNFIGMDKYASYGSHDMMGGATTYILLSEALSVICLLLTDKTYFQDDKYKFVYAMAPAFTFFAPLIASNGSMIRITIYSQLFITVLLPYLVSAKWKENARPYISLLSFCLVYLMLKDGYYPYEFFWKVDPEYLW